MKAYTYIDRGHFALTRLLIDEDILSSTFLPLSECQWRTACMLLEVFSKIRRIGKRQAYLDYHDYEDSLTYWRTDSGYEVDAVLGEGKVAIES